MLRADRICERHLTIHAEKIDRGGAFHRRALSDREEVQAVATSTAATALCDVETNRSGRAFELIAQWSSCRVRQGRDHPGEFKRDPVAVQSLVIEQWLLGREGSGGRPRVRSRRGQALFAFSCVRFKAGLQ